MPTTDRTDSSTDSTAAAAAFAALDGVQVPGGCECHAYQTLDLIAEQAWAVVVHHEDICPQVWDAD